MAVARSHRTTNPAASRKLARDVAQVCRILEGVYGKPRLGNPCEPVDDLVFIVLSNKTAAPIAEHTYRRLREVYSTWDQVLTSPLATLRSVLKPAGLSRVKSLQLRQALRRIRRDFGACELDALSGGSDKVVHEYLTSLPGVSDKVAKCVMMYAMGAQVLPVDAHVHRIAARLGWTERKRPDQCHVQLESLVAPRWRYSFHVGCILHGRTTCRPSKPHCQVCCINRFCEYFRASKQEDG